MSFPSLIQFNTRVILNELGRTLGRRATLDDLPDAFLDGFAGQGFDWVWPLGIWQTGPAGRQVSRSRDDWRREFQHVLPDLKDEDICGSPFAIAGYELNSDFGNAESLPRLRDRLRKRGQKLLLDFVPNHSALDHPWTRTHPEFYIHGTADDLAREAHNWYRVSAEPGGPVFAYGRDPYFPGWPDTLQLNYANPFTQEAMIGELVKIAGQCDGVRCDMAMLVLPDVFERTWGQRAPLFWPKATQRVRERVPGFTFMAEVYWDLEWTLQQQGFDYTYDKRLYDRLRERHARPVREHFHAGLDYQDKLARFLENHDEPRAASAFPAEIHKAAAVITFLSPGLRFFHQGQLTGRTKRISPHLGRAPDEPTDPELAKFYERLLSVLRRPAVRDGHWQLLECGPAWEGNWTWDCFLAFAWQGSDGERLLVAVNYALNRSQCYVRLPFPDLGSRQWRFQDLLGDATYDREGSDLQRRGMYLDVPSWGISVFSLKVQHS